MDEDQLQRPARSGKFIPGVHNYCDRWCERCPLASRCMVRAVELEDKRHDGSPEGDDLANAAFWNKLADNFAVTRRMIEKHCQEMGIELTEADLKAAGDEERRRNKKVRRSSLSKQAMTYVELVQKWFANDPRLMLEKQEMLESIAGMELPGHNPAKDAAEIVEAVDVVRWYQFFIAAKTSRAVGGLVDLEEDDDDDDELADFHESDANGSAKIALIAIDRSLAAWSQLREHFTEQGDGILDILVHLDRLRRQLEEALPTARQFKRPGFDDPAVRCNE